MREESLSTVSRLPADELWDYLADYDRVVRLGWKDASAERLGDGSPTCEVRYKAHTTWEGIRNTYTACLEAAERARTLTWSTRSGGSKSWVRFDLRPVDSASTEVTVTLHLKQGPAFRALEPFAWGLLRPAFVKTVDRIEHLHEELDVAVAPEPAASQVPTPSAPT